MKWGMWPVGALGSWGDLEARCARAKARYRKHPTKRRKRRMDRICGRAAALRQAGQLPATDDPMLAEDAADEAEFQAEEAQLPMAMPSSGSNRLFLVGGLLAAVFAVVLLLGRK